MSDDIPRTIRLTAAETERHDEGDPTVLAYARKRAASASRQRARWNVTAARARLPRVPTRVDIVDATGRYLGHEEG